MCLKAWQTNHTETMRLQIFDNVAIISIAGESRQIPITWDNGFPVFTEPVEVGVLVGRAGGKLWYSRLKIKRNIRYSEDIPSAYPKWVLEPTPVLNTVNRTQTYNIRIANYWDKTPVEQRSKR